MRRAARINRSANRSLRLMSCSCPWNHSDCASNLWITTGRTSPLISDDEARNQAQTSAQNSLDLDLGNGTTPGDGDVPHLVKPGGLEQKLALTGFYPTNSQYSPDWNGAERVSLKTDLRTTNARLKALGCRCSVLERGDLKYLQANLPIKNGVLKKQQRIPLGRVSLKEAEVEGGATGPDAPLRDLRLGAVGTGR